MSDQYVNILDPDGTIGAIVRLALPPEVSHRTVEIDEWEHDRERGRTWCAVFDAAVLEKPAIRMRLNAIRGTASMIDLVAIVRKDPPPPLPEGSAQVAALDALRGLWPAARSRGARMMLRRTLDAAASAAGLTDAVVLRALITVVAAPTPFTHTAPLLREIGCGERTLRASWRAAIVERGGPSLFLTLDAVLLLRMLELDTPLVIRDEIRRSWQIGPDRCSDIAKKLVACSYQEVRDRQFPKILGWFEHRLLALLSGIASAGRAGRQT